MTIQESKIVKGVFIDYVRKDVGVAAGWHLLKSDGIPRSPRDLIEPNKDVSELRERVMEEAGILAYGGDSI
jgi:hypothetical protein